MADAVAQQRAWDVLRAVPDPEIPVLSIVDLGIVRSVDTDCARSVRVGISPTYMGCPATAFIRASVVDALGEAGFEPVEVFNLLSPPWSSDDISEQGREKLRAYGIAPPARAVHSPKGLTHGEHEPACPRCDSNKTERLSEFGSTPCKALYRCRECLEPFDYFKCL